MLEQAPGRLPPISRVTLAPLPELPYQQVDTIVTGQVTTIQPFLSSDHKGIYTEFTVRISDAIKTPAPLGTGSFVTLLREGGIARLPDGKVVKHNVTGDILPSYGKEYLFFMDFDPTLQAFSYSKLWLIDSGIMKPVFPDDLALQGESQYTGKPLSYVTTFIRSKLSK